MIVRKDLELEITFESPREDKEPVTYRFPLNECGKYIAYNQDKPHMDFIGWIDTVLACGLVKYPAYYNTHYRIHHTMKKMFHYHSYDQEHLMHH